MGKDVTHPDYGAKIKFYIIDTDGEFKTTMTMYPIMKDRFF
jgi:hypothetical protein